MSCLPEFTYSVYVDGEATTEEARQVEAHLAVCTACRSLVEGLRAENRLLAEVLHESEESTATAAAPVTPIGPVDILWTGLAVLGTAAALQAALNWLSGVEVPAGINWLNPFSVTVQWNLFFTSLFYFVEEGAAMLLSNVVTVSALVFTLLIAGAGLYLLRRRPSIATMLAAITLALGLALPASALETRKADTVIVGSDEIVDDTLIAQADTIQIDGVVTGNLFAFCRQITINGTVKGDVVTFSQRLHLGGEVGGNILTFVQTVEVQGKVAGSVHAFADRVRLSSPGYIANDVLVGGADVSLEGTVGRDLTAYTGMTTLTGTVERNFKVHTGHLTLLPSARVGGDLVARVDKQKNIHIDPAATVVGIRDIKLREPRPSPFLQAKFYFWRGVWLAAAFLTGLLLYWLFPALFAGGPASGREVLVSLGIGFLALVAVPVAAIIAAITVVGLPLSLMAIALWVAGLYLAQVLVAPLVGRSLLRGPSAEKPAFTLPLLVGLVILTVARNIPYLGGWVSFLVVLLGLGIAVSQVRHAWRRPLPA